MSDRGRGRPDVIVIGAGTAGCIVAQELSNAGGSVTLFDEGAGSAVGALSLLPLADGPQVRWYSTGDGTLLPRGRGPGGSALINAGYFLRWHQADFGGWPWPIETIARAYDLVDGGGAAGWLRASRVDDGELSPIAGAFEQAAGAIGLAAIAGPWSDIGVNRLRLNRRGVDRWTAWDAVEPLRDVVVHGGARVNRIVRTGADWMVETDAGQHSASKIVLTAGTLGTARILLRSNLVGDSALEFIEHREQLVRYRVRTAVPTASALLHTVIHLADGVELRPYNGGFASYIPGLEPDAAAVGVALMRPQSRGSLTLDARGELRVELPTPTVEDRRRIDAGVHTVRELLAGSELKHIVEPESVSVNEPLGTSQHACGTTPLGVATTDDGELGDHRGVFVADASVLPTGGSAGPHATVAAVAAVIGNRLAG